LLTDFENRFTVGFPREGECTLRSSLIRSDQYSDTYVGDTTALDSHREPPANYQDRE
jgi:hypothetical protein